MAGMNLEETAEPWSGFQGGLAYVNSSTCQILLASGIFLLVFTIKSIRSKKH